MGLALHRLRLFQAPRTLKWRIFLVVTILMLASVAVWSAIFSHFDQASQARQNAQTVVSIINLTRTALLNADPDLRKDLLLDLATLEGIRIYPAERDDTIAPLEDTALLRALTVEVRHQLGPETRFASSWENMNGFWVSFRLPSDDPEDATEFWVMLPSARIIRPHAREWMWWGLAALGLALLGTYAIVSRLNRPLKALAEAAHMVGKGDTPPRLGESGPAELAELAHAFNQMSRDLQQLDADRALILAGVSHDLRTPLARLRLGVEMSGAPEADADAMVSDIEDMDRIIGQFLEFSKQDSSETLEPLSLDELASELITLYARRGQELTLDCAGPTFALARPQVLRRAVTNLIENAFRYAGHSPELRVATRDGFPTIAVLDRGPGIPASEVERVKRPFTRLESARSNTKGSGLGLAIVDRIVRGMQGQFFLNAREGRGLEALIILQAAPRS